MKTITAAVAALTLLSGGLGFAPSTEIPATDVVGGMNAWCALSILGGVASALSGNAAGAIVSAAGIHTFC